MMSQQGNRLVWIVWIISFILCLSAGRTIIDLLHRRDIVNVRKLELQQKQQQNKTLEQSLSDMKSEGYIERIARNQLGLVREGETMLILPDQSASNSSEQTEAIGPLWRQWFHLFF